MQQIEIGAFASFNIAIMVLAAGKLLHRRLRVLRSFNIPEPVASGLLVSLLVGALHAVSGMELGFNLAVRDFLLLYFFAGIGLNADIRTLRAGGWPLLILLAATVVYIAIQNLTGVAMASLVGLDPLVGLLTGSVSLVGGHGTAIAWGPRFAELHGVQSAVEIGTASATFGLILSALMGGPLARILIRRLPAPEQQASPEDLRDPMAETARPGPPITSFQLLATLFWLNMCLAWANCSMPPWRPSAAACPCSCARCSPASSSPTPCRGWCPSPGRPTAAPWRWCQMWHWGCSWPCR